MVNHARTLLLNLDGRGFVLGPGEEYTDPAYRAVPLPGYAQAVRAALYGTTPDRRTALVRTFAFLQAIHASPLAGDVTLADPRVTYLPLAQGSLPFGPLPAGVAADLVALAAALSQSGAGDLDRLLAGDGEPVATYRALWASGRPLPERLAAVCLALVAATDRVRNGGG